MRSLPLQKLPYQIVYTMRHTLTNSFLDSFVTTQTDEDLIKKDGQQSGTLLLWVPGPLKIHATRHTMPPFPLSFLTGSVPNKLITFFYILFYPSGSFIRAGPHSSLSIRFFALIHPNAPTGNCGVSFLAEF